MDLKEKGSECVDQICVAVGRNQWLVLCEHSNEFLCSLKGGGFLDYLSN